MSIADRICFDLGMTNRQLLGLVSSTADRYHCFSAGGRKIVEPRPNLKLVQCWISDYINTEFDIDLPYATAYEKGSSVCRNVGLHAKSSHFLLLDICHFFESCTQQMVRNLFSGGTYRSTNAEFRSRLTADDIDLLVALSCYRGSLATGSPCSPFIANRIMASFDHEIAARLGESFVYSRYSDDICISSTEWIDSAEISAIVDDRLKQKGFDLNKDKTRCFGRGHLRKITGIYLDCDGVLRLGPQRKAELKRSLYQVLMCECDRNHAHRVLGHLSFCKQVEPDYYNALLAKYASYGKAVSSGGVMPALVELAYG